MRFTLTAIGLGSLLVGCTEYDIHRPNKQESPPVDEPEPDPEPEPEPDPVPDDPDIELSRVTVDFGGWPKDCESDRELLTISNVGGADLEVSGVEITGEGHGAYTLWNSTGDEFVLAPGESLDVEISFTPNAWVDFEPVFRVTSNDPDEPTADAGVSGFGASDAIHEETFEQDLYESVDVLWVVDNSGSMNDDLDIVARNFSSFIQVFIDLGLDWQMGVITTDMDSSEFSGRLVGPYLTPATPDVVGEFIDQIDLGSGGSATELGFEATEAALTAPLVNDHNAGFMRETAALATIVISDEDNSSFMAASSFTGWYTGLKASPDMVTFNAICENIFFACSKYAEAADTTGGITGDIASSDYASVLETISYTAAGLTVSFDLEKEPSDLSRMTVTVEGVDVPNDLDNGWTYDGIDQSVTFHGTAVPEPGTSGNIAYPVAIDCPTD
jgi:hypothetical protein